MHRSQDQRVIDHFYYIIVDVVREVYNLPIKELLIQQFSDKLARDNPHFNKDKFKEDCRKQKQARPWDGCCGLCTSPDQCDKLQLEAAIVNGTADVCVMCGTHYIEQGTRLTCSDKCTKDYHKALGDPRA